MKTAILFAVDLAAFGADAALVPKGSRVFIAPMDKGLDSFITVEIQKRKLPVNIVLNQEESDYVLTGFSQITGSHWAEQVATSIFGGKDKFEASIKMVSSDGKRLVWSGAAGDRSLVFGALRRGGQWKVAERIVDQLKNDVFSK